VDDIKLAEKGDLGILVEVTLPSEFLELPHVRRVLSELPDEYKDQVLEALPKMLLGLVSGVFLGKHTITEAALLLSATTEDFLAEVGIHQQVRIDPDSIRIVALPKPTPNGQAEE